jgi:hypothetical protein
MSLAGIIRRLHCLSRAKQEPDDHELRKAIAQNAHEYKYSPRHSKDC